jgi:hypothetical protein
MPGRRLWNFPASAVGMIYWVKTGYRTTRPPGTGDDQGPTEVAVELCRDHRNQTQPTQRNNASVISQ